MELNAQRRKVYLRRICSLATFNSFLRRSTLSSADVSQLFVSESEALALPPPLVPAALSIRVMSALNRAAEFSDFNFEDCGDSETDTGF